MINKCNSLYLKRKKRKECYLEDISEVDNFLIDNDIDTINGEINFNNMMELLTLYYAEGYTNKEISKILKTNENTIKARISRAKLKIKNKLKEC